MNGLQLDSTTLIKLAPNTAANEGLWVGVGSLKDHDADEFCGNATLAVLVLL